MTFDPLREIADAILFEGYLLYPYRASAVKNRQHWNFGTLYPHDFAAAQRPEERWSCHSEMLVEGGLRSRFDLCIRFIQWLPQSSATTERQELGIVMNWTLRGMPLEELLRGMSKELAQAELRTEGTSPAFLTEFENPLRATVELRAEILPGYAFRLSVTLANHTRVAHASNATLQTLAPLAFSSVHFLLHVEDGSFISLLDPPADLAGAAAACTQSGVFPVLAGGQGSRRDMLCSPIILYDYPKIAAPSAGDFFDGTEIDEMLSLRLLTLSDEEKQEIRAGDPRASTILERTESLPHDHLLKLHGVLRAMSDSGKAAPEIDGNIEPWDPFDMNLAPDSIEVSGIQVRPGDRVRLRLRRRADILDLAMDGQIAIIDAIEQDLEDNLQIAVVLEDDPGRDLGLLRQPGHRFFFTPDEVEPLTLGAK